MADTPPSSTSTCRVRRDRIEKAVNAILKWKSSQSETRKPQLIPQDDYIYLNLTLKKIPQKPRTNPYKIPLLHPLQQHSPEICLIIDDRPKSKLSSDIAKKIIKTQNLPISKVIKLSKLKSNYKPFESKRKLCDSYDVFFVDKRVVPLLPKLLGKEFFTKKKLPLPVDLTHKNWKEQTERVLSSGLLHLKTGTSSVVKVGKVSMETGEIVDNVAAAVSGVVEVLPKKWGDVRSLHLKLSDSLALPLYQALPDMKLKIEGFKKSEERVKEEGGGELEVKEKWKKDGELRKNKGMKKGRIHEVCYMDGNRLGGDEDANGNESEKSVDAELGSGEFVGKKKKKGGASKEKILNELNGQKLGKKLGKVKAGSDDDDDVGEKSENGNLCIAESGVKKRKKGDSMKGMGEVNGGMRVKKLGKVDKGGSLKLGKDELALKGVKESGEKKGKKKIEPVIKTKDGASKKVKKKNKKRKLIDI
ncbi:unnamed protein product [Ilex paraguariensis]|uniref:Ribosomal protein L1 n=1 Tax=Ilex paraguariensis TaxID=185542 RepID=A0ABC8QL34_9AQUA